MAENKKSFILYSDIATIVDELPLTVKGELFQLIIDYVNDRNPEPTDLLLKTAFAPIKLQLKRDLVKWESIRGNRSDAGKKGMEKRWHNKDNKRRIKHDRVIEYIMITAVKDSVSHNANGNVNDIHTNKHEVFKKRLLENELEKKSIEVNTREEVGAKIISEFNAHLINESKHHNHYSEWKKHLIRWIPKRFKPEVKKSKDMDRVNKILQTNKELKDEIDREYGN